MSVAEVFRNQPGAGSTPAPTPGTNHVPEPTLANDSGNNPPPDQEEEKKRFSSPEESVGTSFPERAHTHRRLCDLGPPPAYDGERRKAAARHWLQECLEYFDLEANLANVVSTDRQRVLLASGWLTGTAKATWDAAKQAARLRPDVNTTPATWADFETWILNRFDELNAKARLLGEFNAFGSTPTSRHTL
ncbi:hypothetical protein KEM55_005982, partial [Ascosphaera atra]